MLFRSYFAPLRVRLWPEQILEPDIVFLRPARATDPHGPVPGADLVVEVVSPGEDARERDLVTKPTEYARAKISEYWIVDPEEKQVTVLVLDGDHYRVHGVFKPGQHANSIALPGFEIPVEAVFKAAEFIP